MRYSDFLELADDTTEDLLETMCLVSEQTVQNLKAWVGKHKYEVLQTEAAAMSRDYLGAMQRLEEQVEHLRQANERLMRGDFSET